MRQAALPAEPMIVAGVMSGTSADGIDVALVRISEAATDGPRQMPGLKLLGHQSFPYAADMRAAVLEAMNAPAISVAQLARLHWRLGELYAEAIEQTCRSLGYQAALAGLHGQTIYHQAEPSDFLGEPVRATWQLGEAAVVAERLRIPVIADFRPTDLAAGGQGAPLVPMLDFCVFRSATTNRVLLNLGGIANVTAIPAGGSLDQVLAFDPGPANMVIDVLIEKLYGRRFDSEGQIAARGAVMDDVVKRTLQSPWFALPPPKSCGREEFGSVFTAEFEQQCIAAGGSKSDAIASACELTVASVVEACLRFCKPHLEAHAPRAEATELIVAGGGARNAHLVRCLKDCMDEIEVKTILADSLGMPAEAKEAAAFALLAWLRVHDRPGNVPSATGAGHAALLGKVSRAI